MPDYRGKLPQILWESGFANTIDIGYPLDRAVSYSQPRAGANRLQGRSGVEDTWLVGFDHYLAGVLRWIPKDNTTGPIATGWDGATGFRAMLEWAWDGNPIRWVFDRTVPATNQDAYLVKPFADEIPELESDFTRRLPILLRTDDGSIWTGY